MDPQAQQLKVETLEPTQKGFLYSVRHVYPDVWHQRLCSSVANSITHMLTIIYRIKMRNQNLRLSPNALLSLMKNDGISADLAADVIKNEGLEEHKHPEPLFESIRDFQYQNESERYKVEDFVFEYGDYDVVHKLKENFGPGGRRYPLIGFWYPLTSSTTNDVASHIDMQDPYRWGAFNNPKDTFPQNGEEGIQHAVLITGLYTMADNPKIKDLSVEIKNSAGANWGDGGYAWVTPDIFRFIGVPVMQGDNSDH